MLKIQGLWLAGTVLAMMLSSCGSGIAPGPGPERKSQSLSTLPRVYAEVAESIRKS
jgi:hypothetical protein